MNDEIIARLDERKRAANAATVLQVQGASPDESAEQMRLAQRAGVPVGVVRSDRAAVQRRVERDDLERIEQSSPALASWARQPDNYAVARDDLGVLELFARLPRGEFSIRDNAQAAGRLLKDYWNAGRATVAAIPQTVGGIVGGTGELYSTAERSLVLRPINALLGTNYTNTDAGPVHPGTFLQRSAVDWKELANAIAPPAEEQNLVTDIAGGVGQLAGLVAQSYVAPQTVFPSLLSLGADQMAERARDAGKVGTVEGDTAVVGGALVTGLTERYGLDRLLNRVPLGVRNQVLQRFVDAAAGGGIEAAQETVEGLAQDLLTRALLDEDHRIGETLLREAEAAGGAGAIARLVLSALGGRRSHAQAQDERRQLDSAVDLAAQSKTMQRAPERFEALVETLHPERQVFIPAEALAEHYGADNVAASVAELTGKPDAYAEALFTGAEIAIPIGRYLSRIGTGAHAALAGRIRMTPGEDIKPDSALPDRAQVEADIAAGLAEARAAPESGGEVITGEQVRPLLTRPELADDWQGYQAAIETARSAQILAREQERQRLQAITQDKQARKQVQAEVERELRSHPVYAARRLLHVGKQPDGTPATNPIKLDHAAVVAALGEEGAGKLKGLTRKHNGATADEAAALLGYGSGAKLLHDLTTAPAFDEMVKIETDARLQARATRSDGGEVDSATDAQAEVMLREIQAIEARNGGIRTHDGTLREIARRLIAEKTVRYVQPNVYRQAEAKAGREAFAAATQQNWREAAIARKRQLLNLYLYREARDARAYATAAGRYLAQFSKTKTRAAIGKAGGDYLAQIDALLERFDFRTVTGPQAQSRQRLADWIKAKAEQGIIVDVPPTIADEAFRVPFRNLRVAELRDLRQAVEHLAHLANHANLVRVADERFDRMMVDEAMALSVFDGNKVRRQRTGDRTLGEKAREELLKARIVTGAATDIARELDGFQDGGAVWRHTVGVIRKANDAAQSALEAAQQSLAETKLKHYTRSELRDLTREKRYFPEVGDSWSKARVLSLALNWGNDGNREAILTQAVNRITPEQAGVLLSSLDARDWAFVQDVWRQIDSYWPQIAEAQKRRKGLAPEKVAPSAFTVTTADGHTLTLPGGYFPLKYEADSVKSMRDEAGDYYDAIRTGRFAKAATRDGHTIERVGSGGRTVRLDLGVVDSHLRDVIRDLHLGEAINFVHTALHGEQFGKAVRDTATVPLVKGLDTWLRDVASGEMGLRTFGEQATRVLRTNFTAAVLTWKVSSAALQLTGFVQSSVVLGQGPMLDGIARVTRRPMALYRYAQEASPFMRRRLQTHVEAVQLVMNAEAGRLSTARAEMIRRGYWMIGRVQSLVDVTTWIAAEKVGMAKFSGDLSRARAFADDVVSRAQGSGEFIDKNALQRGTLGENVRQSEYIRATTALMGYLIAKQNIGYEQARRANLRSIRGASKLASNLVLLFIAEGMVAAMFRGNAPDDEERDGSAFDDWLRLASREGASNLFGGIPGLSQMVSELRGYADRSLVADAWHSVANAITQAEQGEVDKAAAKAGVKVAGFAVGVPSSQLNKTIDAVAAAAEGEQVTPWQYVAGPEERR